MQSSGMPELVAHLTSYLAQERGRIMLDNALGEGLEAAAALLHGIDARRQRFPASKASAQKGGDGRSWHRSLGRKPSNREATIRHPPPSAQS